MGVILVSNGCQMDRSLLGGVHGHTQSRRLTVRLNLALGLLDRTTHATGQDCQEGFYDGFYGTGRGTPTGLGLLDRVMTAHRACIYDSGGGV